MLANRNALDQQEDIMHITLVYVQVKKKHVADFVAATRTNHLRMIPVSITQQEYV